MTNIILFEDEGCVDLQPLTCWRSVPELRIGRRILLDEVAQMLQRPIAGIWTRDGMAAVAAQRCQVPVNDRVGAGDCLVNGRWLPHGPVDFPAAPCVGRVDGALAFVVCDQSLADKLSAQTMLSKDRHDVALDGVPEVETDGRMYRYPWEFIADLSSRLSAGWRDADAAVEVELDPRVTLEDRDRIHIGERTEVHPTAAIDATGGPVFISHDVTIGAQAVIEGPVYLGPGTRVNPRSWLHGGNAIGPVCKIGGEIDGCIMCGYSNKQHDGFLGHVFVGSWVNIGAGTNNSDLKNTYGSIRVPLHGRPIDTGLQFFGAIIGDHAKLGINTTLATGSVVGFGAVSVTTKTVPKYLPSCSWVTDDRVERGDVVKLIDVAAAVMTRRQVKMTDAEAALFRHLHALTDQA